MQKLEMGCNDVYSSLYRWPCQELVISADDDDTDSNATELLPTCGFPKMCEEVWNHLRATPDLLNPKIAEKAFEAWDERSLQSHAIGLQLAEWRRRYAAGVEEFIAAE